MSVMLAGACRNALAQAIPPNPAPTMTTRGKPSRLKAGLPDSSGKLRRNAATTAPSSENGPGPLDQEQQEHRPIERKAHLTATHRVVAEHHDGKKGGCARGEPASNEQG